MTPQDVLDDEMARIIFTAGGKGNASSLIVREELAVNAAKALRAAGYGVVSPPTPAQEADWLAGYNLIGDPMDEAGDLA